VCHELVDGVAQTPFLEENLFIRPIASVAHGSALQRSEF
jgi:hypothetical protein